MQYISKSKIIGLHVLSHSARTWRPARPSLSRPGPSSRSPGISSCSSSAPSRNPAARLGPPSAAQCTEEGKLGDTGQQNKGERCMQIKTTKMQICKKGSWSYLQHVGCTSCHVLYRSRDGISWNVRVNKSSFVGWRQRNVSSRNQRAALGGGGLRPRDRGTGFTSRRSVFRTTHWSSADH